MKITFLFIVCFLSGISLYAQLSEKQVIWKCDTTDTQVLLCIVDDNFYYFLSTKEKGQSPLKELDIKTGNVDVIKTVYKSEPNFNTLTSPINQYLKIIIEPLIYIKLKKPMPPSIKKSTTDCFIQTATKVPSTAIQENATGSEK